MKKGLRIFLIVIFSFVAFAVIVSIIANISEGEKAPAVEAVQPKEPPRELTEAEKAALAVEQRRKTVEGAFSAWDGSHVMLTRFIKDNMNDPKSYEHVETRYRDDGEYITVQAKFRGTNAFGGKVLNTIVARCSLDGQILKIISQE